jgi:uncharacterized repeat protein (TIGR03806 family)
MKQKIAILSLITIAIITIVTVESCSKINFLSTGNTIDMLPKISDYHIFTGNASDLKPAGDFKLYELSTGLFTDYAEKQRLIKVPVGFKLTAINDELPGFPDGTILVKTFYYFNDKRDATKGKKIIETRLLIKSNSKWSAGTYKWNEAQTEALLITSGNDTPVSWTDNNGVSKNIAYHIPANNECATCHNANNNIIPIGPKLRNLNMDVIRNGSSLNQLNYLQQEGILNNVSAASFSKMPDWKNASLPLQDRARAYLDVNCNHCHNEKGFCQNVNLYLGYGVPFNETNIRNKGKRISNFMAKKRMPLIGTTVMDEEGLNLIKAYIKGL